MAKYDLLLAGGRVFDSVSATFTDSDIAITGNVIQSIAARIAPSSAKQVIGVRGKLVTPGLIDLHTHLGFELHTKVIQPNDVCPPAGVTTAIDMGSTGSFTFPWYREQVINTAKVRLFEFINIASLGTISIHTPYYVINYGRYIDEADTIRTIKENPEFIRGIKVFMAGTMVGEWALPSLQAARRVSDATGVPVAVHISDSPPALHEILALLAPGDIVTHCFTSHDQSILDPQGRLWPEVLAARDRGVLFDLGHGAGSFAYSVARLALAQGFIQDTLSTDIYYANIDGPVYDLPTTLSKLLNLGVPLERVLQAATYNPAQIIRKPELGVLKVGGPADIAVLELLTGEFTLTDVLKETLVCKKLLKCDLTLCQGNLIYQRGAA
jgi:dihydroorotase